MWDKKNNFPGNMHSQLTSTTKLHRIQVLLVLIPSDYELSLYKGIVIFAPTILTISTKVDYS